MSMEFDWETSTDSRPNARTALPARSNEFPLMVITDMLVSRSGCEKAIGRLEDSYNVTDLDSFSSLNISGFQLITLIENVFIIKLNLVFKH